MEQILKKSDDLRPYIADKVVSIIKSGDKEYKTVVVVNFVWEARELADLLKNKGIKVGVAVNNQAAKNIHSDEIPALDSIDRYKMPAGNPDSLQVLISPYVASEGFDTPFTEVLVWASPTDSDLRYTQYTGRLARRASGKAFGLIIDCLFQTSQFNWSYNFAMWMKGNVKQMPNGLLYLGPEQDIEGLNELETVRNMRQKADVFDASELNKGLIEEYNKDTDFSLAKDNLNKIFVGIKRKKKTIADKIIAELKQSYPDCFSKKKNYSEILEVIISPEVKQIFIEKMKVNGIELRDFTLEELKESDFQIGFNALTAIFEGDRKKVVDIANKIIDELKQIHSEYFVERKIKKEGGKSGELKIKVITSLEGRQNFINEMERNGIKLRDLTIKKIDDTVFSLSPVNLTKFFKGDSIRVRTISKKIIDELKQIHPEYFAERKNIGGKNAKVIISPEGKKEFIDVMLHAGLKLKDKSEE